MGKNEWCLPLRSNLAKGIRRCYETKGDVDPNATTNGYFYFETIGYPRASKFDTHYRCKSCRVSSVSCRKMHFKHCPLGQPWLLMAIHYRERKLMLPMMSKKRRRSGWRFQPLETGPKKGGGCRETATRGFWKFDFGGTMDNQLFTQIPPKSFTYPFSLGGFSWELTSQTENTIVKLCLTWRIFNWALQISKCSVVKRALHNRKHFPSWHEWQSCRVQLLWLMWSRLGSWQETLR